MGVPHFVRDWFLGSSLWYRCRPMPSPFKVGRVEIGGGEMFLIAGPCVIESEGHALKMAEAVAGVCKALRLPYIFKASYDKANRTSLKSFRGIGMEAGLRALANVKKSVIDRKSVV